MAENPVEDLLVRAYPNPQRAGCPGRDGLLRLVAAQEPLDSDLSQHIWHCSPCFQEFRILRDERRSRERRAAASKGGIFSLVAATLVLAVYLPMHFHQSSSPIADEVAKLDFSQEASVRGADGDDAKPQIIASTAKCCLLVLPPGNAGGDYEVQIRSGSDITKTVGSFAGLAKEEAGRSTKVECKAGCLSLAAHNYVAAWRLRGNEVWHYGMFQVR